ncbi:MAG: sterol desaturase family protein [Gammaproteobacteria bacterium]|nr:sterol desaturase family protein [Gammaproteobacteria bacterium]
MDLSVWLLHHETTIRSTFFFGVLLLIAIWEVISPRRRLLRSKSERWVNNLLLTFLNTLLLRLLFPAAAVGVAAFAELHGWGLFHHFHTPGWLATILAVIILDFAIYIQHILFHAVPLLWRLHRVHHADPDYDVTTGARFHPLEIILSMLIKFATIVVIGAPVIAVVLFEIILNAMAMFNHGNIKLPLTVDHWLRTLLVTPDMHRVHHSVEDDEANSNFGFNLSLWDRLCATYRHQPRQGHEGMTIGIHRYHTPQMVTRLDGMLLLPLRGKVSEYAINRRHWSPKPEEER